MSLTSASKAEPPYVTAAEDLRGNKGQWKAYESEGNCVILAGPGSGKTKTLTIKMARLLAEDVKPPRGIACITYSNQCVRELKRRLRILGVEEGRRVTIGTLHSFCLQHIVLPYARLAGMSIPDPVKVATKDESARCWAAAVESIKGVDEPPGDWIVIRDRYRRTHLDRENDDWYGDSEDVAMMIEAYEQALRNKGLMDFDDMILAGLQMVEQHEWVRRALHARFPILVVDEYQDLGRPLHRLVLSLCFKANMRLVAVGDPDQSIYGFTGAEPALLLELAQREEVESIRLQLNYRCGATIIKASEVALNETRGFKSKRDDFGTVDFHWRPEGIDDQASFVCDRIITEALGRRKGRRLGDIAILYRSQYDGNPIARAVEDRGWDFIRIDQGNPYPRSPLVFWLEDCAAWCARGWRTGTPRLSELIWTWLRFNESISSIDDRRQLRRSLVRYLHSNRQPDQQLCTWLSGFVDECLKATLDREPRLRDDRDAVEKLAAACGANARLARFTVSAFGGQGGSQTHLNLLTLHSAKGMEFDVVVMTGLEEGVLPHYRAKTEEELAEERRLFYVGLTRARHEVHLVYSGYTVNSCGRVFHNGPSRFVREVQAGLNAATAGIAT